MLSGALFKTRIGNPSDAKKDEQLEPTLSEDEASWTSDHHEDPQMFDYSLRPAERSIDTRWGAQPGNGSRTRLNEISDDEDEDVYTSDAEDEVKLVNQMIPEGPLVVPEEPPPSSPPATPQSSKSSKGPKKKKVKQIDGSIPLESPGKLKKTKKKKKKSVSGISPSPSTGPEVSSVEEKEKSGKANKTEDASIDSSPQVFQSPSELDWLSEASFNLKSPNDKSKMKARKFKFATPAVPKMSARYSVFADKLYMFMKKTSISLSKNDFMGRLVSKKNEANRNKEEVDSIALVRRLISEQKKLLAAFEEDENHLGDVDEKRRQAQESFENLVNELQNYETLLELERAEISKQKLALKLKQESMKRLLEEEVETNKALKLRIQQLEEQLASICVANQVEGSHIGELLLQNNNDHQEGSTKSVAMNGEESESKEQISADALDRKHLASVNVGSSFSESPPTTSHIICVTPLSHDSLDVEDSVLKEKKDEEAARGDATWI